jgi:DNA polymerase-3 subunit epsilon
MFTYVAFDVETTGTSSKDDAIVEIGAVRFVKGKPEDSYSVLVDPRRPIPPDATRVHGITNAMVKGQPLIEEALFGFTEFCKDAILIAHNAPFDVRFIEAAGVRTQTPLPQGLVLDTLPLAKNALPDLFNFKLETLVKHFGIPQSGFHRACEDSSYCGLVFLGLLREMKRNSGELKFQNLVNLSGGETRFPFIEPAAQQITLL